MATISFEEDLVIQSNEAAKELATALKQPGDKTIIAKKPPELPKDANAVWFNHSKK